MEFVAQQEGEDGLENIWIAASDGDIDRIQKLLGDGISVNSQDESGYSPLHAAASYGHIELIELLIAAGANVNIEDGDGDTPLLYCEEPEVFDLLLKHGADQLKRNKLGEGIFEKIIEDENEAMMRHLMERGMVNDPEILAKMMRNIEVGMDGGAMETMDEEDEDDDDDDDEAADVDEGGAEAMEKEGGEKAR